MFEAFNSGALLSSGYTELFGRPFVKLFALCYRTVVCPVCLSVLWPNGWMDDQAATWYGGRPRPRRHCVIIITQCRLGPNL